MSSLGWYLQVWWSNVCSLFLSLSTYLEVICNFLIYISHCLFPLSRTGEIFSCEYAFLAFLSTVQKEMNLPRLRWFIGILEAAFRVCAWCLRIAVLHAAPTNGSNTTNYDIEYKTSPPAVKFEGVLSELWRLVLSNDSLNLLFFLEGHTLLIYCQFHFTCENTRKFDKTNGNALPGS